MNGLVAEKELRTNILLVPSLLDFVEGFLMEAARIQGNPRIREHAHDILLATEEWYVNIVRHGFHDTPQGHIHIILTYDDGWIMIRITDDGPPFDPHSIAPAERPISVDRARIGGLGIHLVRKLMDSTDYRRHGKKNILTMKKRCD